MKKFKYLVILLLIFALALTLFACTKDGVKNNPNPPSDFDQPKIWDRQEINERLPGAFATPANSLQEQTDGVRHVVSKYDMLVDAVNMMFYYVRPTTTSQGTATADTVQDIQLRV